MEAGKEHDNIVNANFAGHREELKVRNSPYGPIRHGEVILASAPAEEAPLFSEEQEHNIVAAGVKKVRNNPSWSLPGHDDWAGIGLLGE